LAIAASAVAFTVQQTNHLPLLLSQLPLAAAVACWGVSFYAGCKNRATSLHVTWVNEAMLAAIEGDHPLVRKHSNHPDAIQIAVEESGRIIEASSNNASYWAKLQFRSLILGAVLFIVWHLVEMTRRTGFDVWSWLHWAIR
jgi:hypothetical protein